LKRFPEKWFYSNQKNSTTVLSPAVWLSLNHFKHYVFSPGTSFHAALVLTNSFLLGLYVYTSCLSTYYRWIVWQFGYCTTFLKVRNVERQNIEINIVPTLVSKCGHHLFPCPNLT
jgi:hypothetical protein